VLPFSFLIPPGLPPTYDAGGRAKIRYRLHAQLGIPWWFDKHERTIPMVPLPHSGYVHAEPVSVRSVGDPPDLEVRLEAGVVEAGGWLRGAVAVSNVGKPKTYAGVELVVRCIETVKGDDSRFTVLRRRYVVPVDAPAEGQVIPFQLDIPEAAVPTYRDDELTIEWRLKVTGMKRWRTDPVVHTLFAVVPKGTAVVARAGAYALVGAERTYAWWQHAAERHGLNFDGATLRGTVAGVEVRVERYVKPDHAIGLVGKMSYPSLGLDLSILPDDRWFGFGQSDVQLPIDKKWNRKHHVECREPAQLARFGPALAPHLAAFTAVSMDDERFHVMERDSFEQPDRIDKLAGHLIALAHALQAARSVIEPPSAMADQVDGWRALAVELEGIFEPAAMSVSSTVVGIPTRIWTNLGATGEVLATMLELAPPKGIDASMHFAAEGEQVLESASGHLGSDVAMVRSVCRDAMTMRIDARHVVLAIRAPCPDPLRLAGRARALAQLLSGPSGAYR
jgi:hypothetical protein